MVNGVCHENIIEMKYNVIVSLVVLGDFCVIVLWFFLVLIKKACKFTNVQAFITLSKLTKRAKFAHQTD